MGKQEYLDVFAHKMPKRFISPRDQLMVDLPGERGFIDETDTGQVRTGVDWFGCSWTFKGELSPVNGGTPTPNVYRLEDIGDFADEGVIPTEEFVRGYDWAGYRDRIYRTYDPESQILAVRSLTCFFERMHCLIGFENALCAFYECPEDVHAFFEALLAYKKTVVDCVAEYLSPEVMIFDDDYGTSKSTFISPDMWREFFPQYWRELVDYVHSKGMLFELHSCGYVTPLVGDFVDCGMDILQPLQTNNDFSEIKTKWGDKIILRLAIFDKQMDALLQSEEEIRADIRGYYETLAPGGMFLPDLVPVDDPYYAIQADVHAEFEREFFQLQ